MTSDRIRIPAASSSFPQYGDILPDLMLSYVDLPASLKSCFVYCCIYSKDYEIEMDLLAMQWVAHGLIEEKKGMDVEVTANQCIDDLINRCMTEETEEGDVKLHDTLHDLASYIGRKEYSHASPTEHTSHLSLLDVDDAETSMHNVSLVANKLHTLFCAFLPSEQFTNIKWLRVLSLEECEMDELPNSIECVSLLKYLNLSYSDVKRLPSSIDRLWNLQTLDLSYSKIEEVPEEIGKLCNLRYLGLEEDRRGCNIKVLKDLNNLTGKLSIEGLGAARKEVNLGEAQLLKEKHLLTGLKFDFEEQHDDKVADASEQSCILEALEPPHCLKNLKIRHYKGEMPSWYLKTDYTKLRILKLENCPLSEKLISITSLEKLELNKCPAVCEIASMPSLKSLKIGSCDGLNTIGHDMPALESLEVDGCGRLEQVADDHMPALKMLNLTNLKAVKQLPTHLPSLEVLTVQDLPNWEGWPAIGSRETTISMPRLREAGLENCPKMQTQGLLYALSEQEHDYEPRLQELRVWDCPSARLGWKLLKQLPNLTDLRLDREALESTLPSPLPSEVSTFLPSLEHLTLTDANVDKLKWGRVPEWVWGLSQLDSLGLQGFTEEISLGGHWQCLQELVRLELYDFPNLKSLVDINNTTSLQNDAVATTSPTDAKEQLACLLNLEDLVVSCCPAVDLPQELRDSLEDRLHIETERA
ncbi:putative disease resistance protein RGA3 [Nymphaea colorata]|uniref:putative disease resistance protein RGA3 n=1 Tax=Nymphaea colorata TaxID=210225 RepID=UPI00129D752C|nr:putative disease resistance protein RGA3 [Nymphaea colorata]